MTEREQKTSKNLQTELSDLQNQGKALGCVIEYPFIAHHGSFCDNRTAKAASFAHQVLHLCMVWHNPYI
jgi:hypothetical protein